MKIKTTFVTNSSSSSFIVAWPFEILTKEDVEKFIERKFIKTVFHDAGNQIPSKKEDDLTIKKLTEEIQTGYMNGVDFDEVKNQMCKRENITFHELSNNPSWYRQLWKEMDIKQRYAAYAEIVEFLEGVADESFIYIFEYGDNDGEYFSEMEHGNIFENLPNIRVNKH